MLNVIEKLHALMLSDEVNVWHFPSKKEAPRFYYWLTGEPDNKEGYAFDSLEAMIDAAYDRIDPQKKPTPATLPAPPHVVE